MIMSPKQKEFWREAVLKYHRWNVCSGATRSGKTYLSYWYVPRKVRELAEKEGLAVLIGCTHTTVETNLLEPMREIWGDDLVGTINSKNKVVMFGQLFHVVGAEKKTGVNRLRGQSIKFCIGDEVATWNKEVFQMLKSRLDKEYSCFYGTCNPDHPKHWFKEFIDSDVDIFSQHYTLDDNIHLPLGVANALKQEYQGSVEYQRYILGLWVRAEGIIYGKFSANPEKYYTDYDTIIENRVKRRYQEINIGVDFGGTKSGQAFVATGIKAGYSGISALGSERHFGDIDPDDLGELFVEFAKKILAKYGRVDYAFCDNAEPVLIRGIRNACERAGLPITVKGSIKKGILDRIRAGKAFINRGTFEYTDDCETLKEAIADAVWNENVLHDERLDDGTTDIDTIDAWEYSWEKDMVHLMDYKKR